MDTTDENVTGDAEGDIYPPDAEFDAMDLDAPVSGPGNVPIPRAAGIRQQARANRPMQKGKTKVKKPKSVSKGGGRILAKQKQRQALELRKAGASYHDIAQAVGYKDQSGARKAVIRAFGEVIQEPVTELRNMQVERLNHMLMTLWPKVQQGDESAIRTSLAVMDKMDRLQGTEAAQTMDVNVTSKAAVLVVDGNKDDYIRALRQMSGAGVQPDGTNQPIQAGGPPPGMGGQVALPAQVSVPPAAQPDDVVDGVIVEDTPPAKMSDCTSPLGEVCKDPACPLHFGDRVPAMPTKKKFSFGVDPTVNRKKG